MAERKYALVIVDMQNDFVLPGSPACVAGAYDTVPAIKRLLESFRSKSCRCFMSCVNIVPTGATLK